MDKKPDEIYFGTRQSGVLFFLVALCSAAWGIALYLWGSALLGR